MWACPWNELRCLAVDRSGKRSEQLGIEQGNPLSHITCLCFPHGRPSLPPPRLLQHAPYMTLTAHEAWSRLLDRARQELPEQTFKTWLEPTEALSFDVQTIFVGTPDHFAADW